MYTRIVKSYLQLFTSRGESYSLAQFSTACALSLVMMMNLVTLIPLFRKSLVVEVLLWITVRPGALTAFAILLLLANWFAAKQVPLAEIGTTSSRLSYWHMGISLGLFAVASAIGLAQL